MKRTAAGGLALLALGAAACNSVTYDWAYVDNSPSRTLAAALEVTVVEMLAMVDDLAVDPLTGDYVVLSMEGSWNGPVVTRVDRDGGSILETFAVPEMLLTRDDEGFSDGTITLGATPSGKFLLSDGATKHALLDPAGALVTTIPDLLAEADHAPYSLATGGAGLVAVEESEDAPPQPPGDDGIIVSVEKYPCPEGTIDFWSIGGQGLVLVRSVFFPPVVTDLIKTTYVSRDELLIVQSREALRVLDARSGEVIARLVLPGFWDGADGYQDLSSARIGWDPTKNRLAVARRDAGGVTTISSYDLPLEGL